MKFDNFEIVNPQIVPADRKRELDRRFWAFAYATYYPGGGLKDLVATGETLEEVMIAVEEARKDFYAACWHVYDRDTGEIVAKGSDHN